ncbi:1-deoxy-D-xylulose-5-phosphate reductoisomerase [Polynucleobacter sp. AM-26B4]|uniref:1-deoxy-D-xylulose-5-phosphate reductoisomerase n=1 Tax=Polynucleobacter sp. AM-26B4 TaxID=2689103 RepID=UPI001C0AAC38|nr:1-deoxy-D-xylulose-5-phosphate reductoisomerase [Polynucleobacter sp. AM-26B4]MBU3584618.1 1-deoxy-D-xylulose-5-phosphate reductoisomerase [Polynucleobacter sp. AM-26B4]
MRHICVLGSTGSIGVSTLDVIRAHPELFKVESLTAHSNIELLAKQCEEFKPTMVVVGSADAANRLNGQLKTMGLHITVEHGAEALVAASTLTSVDTVMAAIVGAAGLLPTIEAAKLGKRILLANKEALVMAGDLFMSAVASSSAELLPIDSEHNAIYQCLPDANTSNGGSRGKYASLGVKEILLTASGGPFRNHSLDQLKNVTPDQACAHPNWVMGRKISVDSATMMNKGLEVIEAHHLFGLPAEQIKVLIHPQSVVHSMVRYIDGSVIAQLGQPDMKTPIAYGLGWPSRIDAGVKELDFTSAHDLSFEPVDLHRFPCLSLSYQALASGGLAPTILNAANEVAVDSFLNHGIRFTQIPELVERVLNQTQVSGAMSLEGIFEADKVAREHAQTMVKGLNA